MSTLNRSIVFKKVLSALKKNPYGLSSTQLSQILKINRMTLVKYLSVMRAKGLVEYKTIGMAKVWHTSTKYDLISLIASEEAASIQLLLADKPVKIRDKLEDSIPLSLFRAMKAALALSSNPERSMYEAGQFIAQKCFTFQGTSDPSSILENMAEVFIKLNLGIVMPIQIQPTVWTIKLGESASAHGTAVRGNRLCFFEAGLMSGIISAQLNKRAITRETKCVGEGSAFCEFIVKFLQ